MMNIVMVGFMGTGKTSVSRALARKTGWHCLDVDEWVVKKAGRTIPAIFEAEGEEGFRNRETEALREIRDGERQIVAGGGGIVLRPENIAIMKARGTVVCLTASPETVFARVGRDSNRPNLNGRRSAAGIAELMEKREMAYREAADLLISTDHKTVDAIAEELRERLGI